MDGAIGRILEALERSGMAGDTIVVFTSDHGDLVGAHGGLMQKWYNAYDEALRVPLVVKGPGVAATDAGVDLPTSHVDLVPTLMGLAGIDAGRAAEIVAREHDETHPLPGRDLSRLITGSAPAESFAAPLYFMTEDDVARGQSMRNMFTGSPYGPMPEPSKVESVVAVLPTGTDGSNELWKLNHYYERLDDFDQAHDLPRNPFAGRACRCGVGASQPDARPRRARQPLGADRRGRGGASAHPRGRTRRQAARAAVAEPANLRGSERSGPGRFEKA